MSQPAKTAAGFIIYRVVEEIQYLLLQASYEEKNWSPPKGHVDPGEDELTTAFRETEEEAGLTKDKFEIDQGIPPVVLKYNVRGSPKTVDYWVARLKNPETPIQLSEEHTDFKWANVDTAVKITFPSMSEAIGNVHKSLVAKLANEKCK